MLIVCFYSNTVPYIKDWIPPLIHALVNRVKRREKERRKGGVQQCSRDKGGGYEVRHGRQQGATCSHSLHVCWAPEWSGVTAPSWIIHLCCKVRLGRDTEAESKQLSIILQILSRVKGNKLSAGCRWGLMESKTGRSSAGCRYQVSM